MVTLAWFSFYELAIELSGPAGFFQSFVQQTPLTGWLLVWVLAMAGLVQWNVFRFPVYKYEDDRLAKRNRALEETVDEAPSAVEGIERAMSVLKDQRKEWDPIDAESFLRYLTRRDDEVGAEARRRLIRVRRKEEDQRKSPKEDGI